ncbi:MAG: HIT domain-containing protein [Candidatus Omnitrophota bacterium]|jgi:ATP adenylyltransferase
MKSDTKHLWAPWRSRYIYSRKKKKCIFCDPKEYVLEKTKHSFSMLNIYPYNNGHVMVAPFRHVKSLEYLKAEELKDLMDLVVKTKKVLDKKIRPHGYNIGINIGKAAGAGFAGHVHIHIVPRWTGDTNFMPASCGTKVISESLDVMHKIYKSSLRGR